MIYDQRFLHFSLLAMHQDNQVDAMLQKPQQ